jgi:uncharacterized protein YjdB
MRKKQAVLRSLGIGFFICVLLLLGACVNPSADDPKSSTGSAGGSGGSGGGITTQPQPQPTAEDIVLTGLGTVIADGAAIHMTSGASATFSAAGPAGAAQAVKWDSLNPAVATVTNGIITPLAPGNTTITATSTTDPGKACSFTVHVESGSTPITGITLDNDSGVLNVAKGSADVAIAVTYAPFNTTQQGVSWSSDDADVATVNNNGVVHAVAAGTAGITATSTAAPAITKTISVTVIVPVSGIKLDKATLDLTRGGADETLAVAYAPSDTTQTIVTWSSSDTAVATVDNSGVVHAVAAGTATITATSAANPGIRASCVVAVAVPVTGLSLPAALDTGAGDDFFLTVGYLPSDTTQTGVTWSSSNTAVATVAKGLVHAVKSGTATITATSTANPGISASCVVAVEKDFSGAGVTFEFKGFEDETVALTGAVKSGNKFVLAAPAGFDRYLWYIASDNNSTAMFIGETSNPTLTFPASFMTDGYITVIVDDDGYHFSKTLHYAVGY